MQLSKKQNEYIINATHRWNIKSGAVRSGKSYVDTAYIVPKRIRERAGKPGLNVIMGVSKESIERNVLQPMREIYTSDLIGNINNRNVARVCGEDVYCLGAEKVSQVAKIQGASIKYCYGDEIAKWNKEVFQMLKSRLDKTYSCFDGACNPENPTHWLKEFLDNKKLDIYLQRYTIFDNPFLAPDFVEKLCIEYDGTVYYDRLILGLWKRAEGAIYRKFADHPEDFVKEPATVDLTEIVIGVDFGGNKSGHSFVARGYDRDNNVYGLKSIRYMNTDTKRFKEGIDSNILNDLLIQFVNEVQEKYGKVDFIYWDNAETTLGQSIRNAMIKAHLNVIVRPAKKIRIKDRIECVLKLMGAGRFFITEDCETLSTALQEAVWDEKALKDDRLDDGSSDIDTLDAFEYTIERDIKMLTE